jgi:hypothetical protein
VVFSRPSSWYAIRFAPQVKHRGGRNESRDLAAGNVFTRHQFNGALLRIHLGVRENLKELK